MSGATGASYRLCRRVHAMTDRSTYLATRLFLPPSARPHAHALYAFFTVSDTVADDGDPELRRRAFARWSEASLAELRAGHSEHPLRAALVHTAGVHGLEIDLFERFLAATRDDNTGAVEFATFADLRRFTAGVGGVPAVLGMRLLMRADDERDRLISLLGEVFQFVDVLRDLSVDLPAGRVYLPVEDLERFGVTRRELTHPELTGEGASAALDALVRFQVDRVRALQREAAVVVDDLPARARTFVAAGIEVHNTYFDALDRLGGGALRRGVRLPRLRLLRRVGLAAVRRRVAGSGDGVELQRGGERQFGGWVSRVGPQ
ncbi:squalene/phytoene synthase family protein [Umezawaea sp. Da 62-37]|uniref:phytoene/squalene synthase family protein n=1 Tax=Umezawaea sp. Da 62-37 TaxID=3075927 RepID=UPI0028F6CDD2|nr:squalene/phytoene synthase family protein [Umezawaea sp. Da 62-37]WNV86126.1 squalene/phytoene synthase family protein [Umezawaea sp. Da 62-37]